MYTNIPIKFVHKNPFRNLHQLIMYCHFANMADKETHKYTVKASNKGLDEVFNFSHHTYYLTFLELGEMGICENQNPEATWCRHTERFKSMRKMVLDSSVYEEAVKDSKSERINSISVKSYWLTDWKLPPQTAIMLGVFWAYYVWSKRTDDIVEFEIHSLMDYLGIQDMRTLRKHLNLLVDLGLVSYVSGKKSAHKVLKINTDLVNDDDDHNSLFESETLVETAKSLPRESRSTVRRRDLSTWLKRMLRTVHTEALKVLWELMHPFDEMPEVVDKYPWEGLTWYEIKDVRDDIRRSKGERTFADDWHDDIWMDEERLERLGGYAYG